MRDTTIDRVKRILSGREKRPLRASSLKPAAVLLLLYSKDGKCFLILNKRSQEVEYHKGEISFPGGSLDPVDTDMLACALRETWEEMGVQPRDVTVLGELDEVQTRSDFVIHTYVGVIPNPYSFQVSSLEVAEILEVPVSTLLDRRNHREEVRLGPNGQLVRSLAYVHNHHLIYGATARIIDQFLDLLNGASNGH